MTGNKGTLYLIPNVISEGSADLVLSPEVKQILPSMQHFLAEDVRTARRFLSALKVYPSVEPLQFSVLNKDTKESDLNEMMSPLTKGMSMGVISESGCPGVADPGALAVAYAHRLAIRVVPLVGPSSILLALMASGLNGQQFAFHGYLPVEAADLAKMLKSLEKESNAKNQTQIFIETPYRNNALFRQILTQLKQETYLTIAVDLTGKSAFIHTKTIGEWSSQRIELPKMPAVFLFLAKG
jgi:16S rRNA (cytidine1402-2'-O)-methyltransferase